MRTDFSIFKPIEPRHIELDWVNRGVNLRAYAERLAAFKKIVRLRRGKDAKAFNDRMGFSTEVRAMRSKLRSMHSPFGGYSYYKYAAKPYVYSSALGTRIDGRKQITEVCSINRSYSLQDRLRVFREHASIPRNNLRTHRRQRKALPANRRERQLADGYFAAWLTWGNSRVFSQPEQILNMQKERVMQLIYTEKRPKVKDEHVGIEIECLSKIPAKQLGEHLRDAGLARFIHLKDDGSLRTQGEYSFTHELALCIPVAQFADVVKKTCTVLRKTCAINQSCGLHVHLDMRQFSTRTDPAFNRIFSNLVSCNGVFQRMLPASRRANEYCERNREKEFTRAVRTTTRYWMVNPLSWQAHRTLEVRCHSGTINPEKIVNWVSFLLAIKNHTGELKHVRSVKGLAKTIGLSAELTAYLEVRTKKFKDKNAQEELPPVGNIADARLSREERQRRQAEFEHQSGDYGDASDDPCQNGECETCYPSDEAANDIPF